MSRQVSTITVLGGVALLLGVALLGALPLAAAQGGESYQSCAAAQFEVRADWSAEGQQWAALTTEGLTVELDVGSITVEKSQANGALPDEWDFDIAGPDGFPYLAGSGELIPGLPLGTYTITEVGPDGWHLSSVSGEGCGQEGQTVEATLISPGQSITCTLTNEVDSPRIALEKQVSDDDATWHDADTPPGPYIVESNPAFWRFIVANTGNVDLTAVVVTDTVLGEICTIDSLAAGAEESCPAISFVSAGQHENVGLVAAQYTTSTVTAEDPCHYFGVGYLVPTATPTPEPSPSPTETATPTPEPPAPPEEKATPVSAAAAATPIPATPSPTQTPFVEVLGVERLPESGAPPFAGCYPAWLTAAALLLIASGAALRLLRGER